MRFSLCSQFEVEDVAWHHILSAGEAQLGSHKMAISVPHTVTARCSGNFEVVRVVFVASRHRCLDLPGVNVY